MVARSFELPFLDGLTFICERERDQKAGLKWEHLATEVLLHQPAPDFDKTRAGWEPT